MAATSTWLSGLLYGVRKILLAGVELPERSKLNFAAGFTVVDNAALGTTDVTAAAASDATTTTKGIVKLAGSLAGTALLPTVTAVDGDGTGKAMLNATRLSSVDGPASIDSYRAKLATSSATPTTILTLPIPTGAFARVDVLVICRDAAPARRTFTAARTCENTAGTVGSVTTIGADSNSGTGTHAVTFTASGSNLLVKVTGTATACNWVAVADVKATT